MRPFLQTGPRRSEEVFLRRLGSSLLLVTTQSQCTLNETGELIWKLCDGKKTVEEIAKIVARRCHIPFEMARQDCQAVLKKMMSRGIIIKGKLK